MSEQAIIELIQNDKYRLGILRCVQKLPIEQAYVAAGFIRNMVWDHLHDMQQPTELMDVDVIYFDANEPQAHQFQYQLQLQAIMPEVTWQVRNQAYMHIRNKDKPYQDLVDAMSFWPEKETAIAIRKINEQQFECVSAFALESLFGLKLSYNPKRQLAIFQQRLADKQWLKKWPKLQVVV